MGGGAGGKATGPVMCYRLFNLRPCIWIKYHDNSSHGTSLYTNSKIRCQRFQTSSFGHHIDCVMALRPLSFFFFFQFVCFVFLETEMTVFGQEGGAREDKHASTLIGTENPKTNWWADRTNHQHFHPLITTDFINKS